MPDISVKEKRLLTVDIANNQTKKPQISTFPEN